jgi:hypothetical protein
MQQFLRCEHTQHEIKESGVGSPSTFAALDTSGRSGAPSRSLRYA